MPRPDPSEYAPYYARYIDLLPERPILELLAEQGRATVALLRSLPEERGGHRYEPGKWTVKEVVGHVTDSERVFGYRALRIARGDTTPLPGFEQDDYVRAGSFGRRSLRQLADELEAVRKTTVLLFQSLDEEAMGRRGVANNVPVSVRALAHIIAGHERHHVAVLRDCYGISAPV